MVVGYGTYMSECLPTPFAFCIPVERLRGLVRIILGERGVRNGLDRDANPKHVENGELSGLR